MKIFLAGASGVIGKQLSKLLVAAGHEVYGTTRSEAKAKMLENLGVKPVILDVFDKDNLIAQVAKIKPEVVFHQLTDLPDGLDEGKMSEALKRNAKIREVGTANLLDAAKACGASKFIAQSIAFVYSPNEQAPFSEESALLDFAEPTYGETARAVHSLETQTIENGGVVLRYGWLYGRDSGFSEPVNFVATVHVDAAAKAAELAMNAYKSGIYNISEDNGHVSSQKAKAELKFDSGFRIAE
ncbi:NAD(P)-dependent oxidoreductase [Campylobacter sp. 19-13652]|uniref:NAD-dependent epimerase/dehydratase family protein n=1 Tax=Campylobacter sp. 19-13652 TaxID=2840180 RepID=UPI001C7542A0|nr:NAD(P)-dependent oxidoreductase [Campylobacter sp. 19-13652]BCX79896.1 dTDP-glucose 4,6-dehydratase [Campylobacter sp. 19-13652]